MLTLLGMLFAGIKTVLRFCALLLKIAYRILKALKVRFLALYLAACLILHLALHPFEGFGIAYFAVGLAACLLLTLYGWTRPLREARKRRELKRRADAPPAPPAPSPSAKQREKAARKEEADAGKFYRVEGHPEFVFRELSDRYELYREGEGELEYVRTDYKNIG